jgi:hypothetical protein
LPLVAGQVENLNYEELSRPRILEMRWLDGWSLQEIASKLGMSLDCVRDRHFRAFSKVQMDARATHIAHSPVGAIGARPDSAS